MDPLDYLNEIEEKERYLEHNNDVCDPRYQAFVSPLVNAIMRDFQKDTKGLDYGCGTGPVISKMLSDHGFEMTLYDPYFHPSKEVLDKSYDFIVCNEVMEHFYHPHQEFKKLYLLLKPGGVLYLKTKILYDTIDFENWYYKKDPTHVFFYKEKTLKWLEENTAFKSHKDMNTHIEFKK